MRGDYRICKARKEYRCSEATWHTIRKGDLYLRADCPPEHETNDGRKWWAIKACLRCVEEYGLHNSETRDQLRRLAGKPT